MNHCCPSRVFTDVFSAHGVFDFLCWLDWRHFTRSELSLGEWNALAGLDQLSSAILPRSWMRALKTLGFAWICLRLPGWQTFLNNDPSWNTTPILKLVLEEPIFHFPFCWMMSNYFDSLNR